MLHRRDRSIWFRCLTVIASHLGFASNTEGCIARVSGEDRRPNREKKREKSLLEVKPPEAVLGHHVWFELLPLLAAKCTCQRAHARSRVIEKFLCLQTFAILVSVNQATDEL